MGGHTPGPWSAQPSELGPDDKPFHWYVVAGNGRYDPAIVSTWPGSVDPERDARLISAAPDMLEALEGLVASVRGVGPKDGKVLARADAAIAKARGEV
jgi:hypothetical protein